MFVIDVFQLLNERFKDIVTSKIIQSSLLQLLFILLKHLKIVCFLFKFADSALIACNL